MPNVIDSKELEKVEGGVGIKNFKDHTDPKYIGPGHWFVMHSNAIKAKTKKEITECIQSIKKLCKEFPCVVCRTHSSEYLKNHPIEKDADTLILIDKNKKELGLFMWTWKFHNSVNFRTKKPLMNWSTAYNLFAEKQSQVCSMACLTAENNNELQIVKPKPYRRIK